MRLCCRIAHPSQIALETGFAWRGCGAHGTYGRGRGGGEQCAVGVQRREHGPLQGRWEGGTGGRGAARLGSGFDAVEDALPGRQDPRNGIARHRRHRLQLGAHGCGVQKGHTSESMVGHGRSFGDVPRTAAGSAGPDANGSSSACRLPRIAVTANATGALAASATSCSTARRWLVRRLPV